MSKFSHTFIFSSYRSSNRYYSFEVSVPFKDSHYQDSCYKFLVVSLGNKFCVECYFDSTCEYFNPEFVGICPVSYDKLFELIEAYICTNY